MEQNRPLTNIHQKLLSLTDNNLWKIQVTVDSMLEQQAKYGIEPSKDFLQLASMIYAETLKRRILTISNEE